MDAVNQAQAKDEAEQRAYNDEIERRLSSMPGMRLRLVERWLVGVGGVILAFVVTSGISTQLLSTSETTGQETPYSVYIPIPFILGALWAWALSDLSKEIASARSKLRAEYPPRSETERARQKQDALDAWDASNPPGADP